MTLRDSHVPMDRLAALALAVDEPRADEDSSLAAHLAGCTACTQALARLTAQVDHLRYEACCEADAHFDDAALNDQRARVLDRIAHLGRSARVIAFPAPRRPVFTSSTGSNRRWISVAAAAGLIIGLLTGQILHLASDSWRQITVTPEQTARVEESAFVRTAARLLSEDELLDEIDLAVQPGSRAEELRALDALTPTMNEIR